MKLFALGLFCGLMAWAQTTAPAPEAPATSPEIQNLQDRLDRDQRILQDWADLPAIATPM
jgi:hypothetical protein